LPEALGKCATETPEMLREGFGEHALNLVAPLEWHSLFKDVRVSNEDYEPTGRINTSKTTGNVDVVKIQELIHEDRRRIIHEQADTVGIRYGICGRS
jgi:hypothetical protein